MTDVSEPDPVAPAPAGLYRRIARWPFTTGAGLRGGWRVLIFFLLFIAGSELLETWLPHSEGGVLRAAPLLARESLQLLLVLGATGLLGAFEKRSLRDYGLPLAGGFGRRFGSGLTLGFATASALVLALVSAGTLRLGGATLPLSRIVASAALWALVFLVVGFFEELLLRGYAQATLARSLGFWPAAVLLSCLFAAMHARNPGETPLGLAAVCCFGLFFSFTLKRTGNLWLAIGFHASWDWAESFFYGVPNSGTLVTGHLLTASFSGPAWLSGGSAGPEGSVMVLAVLAGASLMVARARRTGAACSAAAAAA
jgi:membrane protease YdiL (CAAX protease family)